MYLSYPKNLPDYSLSRLGGIFSTFTSYKWDIQPNTDLQEGSAMHSVIDLLYPSHHMDVALRADRCFGLAQFRWLCRQRQVSIYFDLRAFCILMVLH